MCINPLLSDFLGTPTALLPGPAAVLFVGVIASQGFRLNTIYTSMIIGGIFITFLGPAAF